MKEIKPVSFGLEALKMIDAVYLKLVSNDQLALNGHGLHFGKSGLLLFFAYYYKLTKNEEVLREMDVLIDEILESLTEEVNELSFSDGAFGMLWALKHTNELLDFIAFDKDYFIDLEKEINTVVLQLLEDGHDDFMQGGLGGILALNASDLSEKSGVYFSTIINNSTYKENGEYLWLDYLDEGEQYNLGLAHGQPAIWYFLAYLASLNEDLRNEALLVITASYKTICNFKTKEGDFPSYGTIHNNQIVQKEVSAKLSWCYGDLSLANTLVLIGQNLGDEYLYNEGLTLGLKTTEKNTMKKANVCDLCLCHGSSSMLSIYQSLYLKTKNESFMIARDTWFEIAKKYWDSQKIVFHEPNKTTIEYGDSLLNGYVGFGLTLLGVLEPDLLNWSTSILLH